MGLLVVSGALIACRCGTKPSRLSIPPVRFSTDLSVDLPTVDFALDFSLDLPQANFALDFSVGLSLNVRASQTLAVTLPQFGVFTQFHANGNLALQANFEFGKLEGACLIFDVDGEVMANLNFHLGALAEGDLLAPQVDLDVDFQFDLDPGAAFSSLKPIATIKDHIPNINIHPFGSCKSKKNPAVAAAGKPAPCTPKTNAPWMLGATMHVGGSQALSSSSMLACAYGCVIMVVDPGQSKVTVLP